LPVKDILSKWGLLGLFNLPGLSILLLIPTRNSVNLETLESEGSENDPLKELIFRVTCLFYYLAIFICIDISIFFIE